MRLTHAINDTLIERAHSPACFFGLLKRASAVYAGLRVTSMKPLCQVLSSAESLSSLHCQVGPPTETRAYSTDFDAVDAPDQLLTFGVAIACLKRLRGKSAVLSQWSMTMRI